MLKRKRKPKSIIMKYNFKLEQLRSMWKINILYFKSTKTRYWERWFVNCTWTWWIQISILKFSILVSYCKFCIWCILIMAILKQDVLEMFKSKKQNNRMIDDLWHSYVPYSLLFSFQSSHRRQYYLQLEELLFKRLTFTVFKCLIC